MKVNCWEFKKCGRQEGGSSAGLLGVCPAAKEQRLDGVHNGKNAGRSCWIVAGTMCGAEVQGTFAQKIGNCRACDFFGRVKQEEGLVYELSIVLLNRIRAFEKILP